MQRILPFFGLLLVFACSPDDKIGPTIETIENIDMDEASTSNSPEGPIFDGRNKETLLAYFDALIEKE